MQTNTDQILAQVKNSLRNKTVKSTQENGELGKNEFLNLFMTQLSHQDPTKPMDSSTMMTQLSQLGSMEQLENINHEMQILNAKQAESTKLQALNFLDKDVLIEQKEVELKQGRSDALHFSLDREASNLKVIIEEEDGTPVITETLGLLGVGRHRFDWDGKNLEGTLMADGKYKVRLVSFFADGSSQTVQPYFAGRVSNLEYKKGVPWVSLQGRDIPLSQIKSVDTSSQRIFGNALPLPVMQNLEAKKMTDQLN